MRAVVQLAHADVNTGTYVGNGEGYREYNNRIRTLPFCPENRVLTFPRTFPPCLLTLKDSYNVVGVKREEHKLAN